MDDIQLNWLLETFFKNEQFAGWRNIAEKLIKNGSCITTNQGENIWRGGIGNFISSKPYEDGVDCIELTFNIKEFISIDNKYFLEAYSYKCKQILKEQEDMIKYVNSIKNLTSF